MQAELIAEIRVLGYIGSETWTHRGLKAMREQQFTHERGDREWADNVAVVITDGKATTSDYKWEVTSAK